MNHRIRARVVMVAAALAMAGTGLTGSAHAEGTGWSDALVVSGCLNTNPPVPAMGGIGQFDQADCKAPFDAAPPVCLITSDGGSTVPTPEGPENCSVTFHGTYSNLVCGTGTASGTATLSSTNESYVISFNVTFVAGQGVITGNSPSTEAGDPGDTWAGVVDIVPTDGTVPPCPITQFRFSAVIAAVDA